MRTTHWLVLGFVILLSILTVVLPFVPYWSSLVVGLAFCLGMISCLEIFISDVPRWLVLLVTALSFLVCAAVGIVYVASDYWVEGILAALFGAFPAGWCFWTTFRQSFR